MMKFLIYLITLLTKVQSAQAYVPDINFILDKSTSTTGRQIISIDQDVIFKVGTEEAIVQETWFIEGDKNLKLVARGKGSLAQNINLHYLYNAKNKTSMMGKNKITNSISNDFFQKLLFIRSSAAFKNHLIELSIKPDLRLSRADGRISFAIGQPSAAYLNPQIWIDQDDFVIRKIRLPSGAEIELSEVVMVFKDLWIAKSQLVHWDGHLVQIKIKNISLRLNMTLSGFSPQNLDQASEVNFVNKNSLNETIDQFYKRFR